LKVRTAPTECSNAAFFTEIRDGAWVFWFLFKHRVPLVVAMSRRCDLPDSIRRPFSGIRDGIGFRLEVVPRIGRSNVVFICDDISPVLICEFLDSEEAVDNFLCCVTLGLHRVVGTTALVLSFDDPIDALVVERNKVREVAVFRSLSDDRLIVAVQPVPPLDVWRGFKEFGE
jgi:hypothetical protein